MSADSSFRSMMSKLPLRWEKVLSSGLSYFIQNQDPDDVEFEFADNGYRITVKTDKQNTQEAKEFIVNHVVPKLDDDLVE